MPNPPADKGRLNLEIADKFEKAVAAGAGGEGFFQIRNSDRSVGARLSGIIARAHGNTAMSSSPITLRFSGTAGQSFGAWNAGGLHMILSGDANDYVGKGMAGGKLVIRSPEGVSEQRWMHQLLPPGSPPVDEGPYEVRPAARKVESIQSTATHEQPDGLQGSVTLIAIHRRSTP